MSELLQDLSAPALITAIEANQLALFPLFGAWPKAETHQGPDMFWSVTSIPFPLFNSVFRARLAPEDVDAAIETAITRCRSRNVPMAWSTGPATRPADLGRYLEAHGFSHAGDSPGMAVDLATLVESRPNPLGLSIQQVGDDETIKQWCRAMAIGFDMPEFVADAMADLGVSTGVVAHPAFRLYLGWFNGEPVATSMLLLGAGVAGLYNVTTVPAARRQGIGSAITLAPLREARALGYRVGILQASPMGLNVYSQLGFREYCKISHYLWAGDRTP